MIIIPATQEAETGRYWLEASPGKVVLTFHLKNKLKAKGLGTWL
jgi:hypothetical protein